MVAAHLPDYQVHTVLRIGEGLDNVVYAVNGELIVRTSNEPDPARTRQEARLLETVAEVSPLPVPRPVFTDPAQGCLAYMALPGRPLLELPPQQRQTLAVSIAGSLGELLTALHILPVTRVAAVVDQEDVPLAEWVTEAAAHYRTVAEQVPAGYRRGIEAFLAAAPPLPAQALVFSHNDLGIEHVLIDPAAGQVTGIVDWSDAAIVDPAYDFGLLYRDLGPAALRQALRHYRTGIDDVAALRERAVFYARCSVFEDLAFGVATGAAPYVDKSLAALEWLFPS